MESVLVHNTVRKIREKHLMSKAELARNADISPLTVDRIEKGMGCRIETKRKIILAFGYDFSDKGRVFKNGY
ncbi:helix-turn-helix transcriptional regulator [Thermodesulfobacteriota bacterium]